MRLRKKILFSAVILAAALLALEAGLRLLGPGGDARKVWIATSRGMGHCYSAPAPGGGLPLDLARPAHRARMQAIFKEGHSGVPTGQEADISFARLTRATPHCITYDTAARARGFHPKRKKLVALVGDSFAFGEGLRDADTLGHLLGQAYPSANFRTLARPGSEIEDCFAMVFRAVNDLDARSVVYFYNLNDVTTAPDLEQEVYVGVDFGAGDTGLARRLSSVSRLVGLVHSARVARARTAKILDGYLRRYNDPRNQKNVRETMDKLEQMAGAARERGAAFVVVLYPMLHRGLLGQYPLASIHEMIMAECKKRSVPCVDGQGAFDGLRMSRYHVHRADSHPNGRANRAMVRFLQERKAIVIK